MVLVEEERLHPESSLPKFGENRKPLSVKCGPRAFNACHGPSSAPVCCEDYKCASALTTSKISAE